MTVTKIDQSGDEFLDLLFRHHFGCERSEPHPVVSPTSEDLSMPTPLDAVGARFVTDVLRHFHNDGSFLEIDQ